MNPAELLDYRERPARGVPDGLLVLFHGRAADEADLYPLLDALDPTRRLLGITPRGPLSLPPGGAHWYAVERVGYPDPQTFGPTFQRSRDWLAALQREAGIPAGRTVLGGFSQGAVMSYALGLGQGQPRPAATIALSGFIPTVDGFNIDLETAGPAIAIGHGTMDPVISVDFARQARRQLQAVGREPLYQEAPIPHTTDPAFLARLEGWITTVLPPSRTNGG